MELSLAEIARCLNVADSTLERWIRQGRIPVQRTGGEYRFNLSVLERWAENHHMSFILPTAQEMPAGPVQGSLQAAMGRGGIHRDVAGAGVTGVLKNAVARLRMLSEDVRDDLYDRLVRRERLTSTGIGRGVAIPHPRSPLGEAAGLPLIATCYLETPVDFGAVDDQPVFVLFLLLSDSIDGHLRLLSHLAFCLRDDAFITFLRGQPDVEALGERIAAFQAHLEKQGY